MTRDPETLEHILQYVLFVAAFFATAFPVIYMFSPWYKTWLGRTLMLHGVTLAVALDVTALFQFWQPTDILVYFWFQLITFTLVGIASAAMAWQVAWMNHIRPRFYHYDESERLKDG